MLPEEASRFTSENTFKEDAAQSADPSLVQTFRHDTAQSETKMAQRGQSLDSDYHTISAFTTTSEQETPITSEAPSEADSTQPTTPSSVVPQPQSPTTPRQSSHGGSYIKTAVPIIPLRPVVPAVPQPKASAPSIPSAAEKESAAAPSIPSDELNGAETTKPSPEAVPTSPVQKSVPKSWAELLRKDKPAGTAAPAVPGVPVANGVPVAKATTLGDVIRAYTVDSTSKISFIEPRGLVNTGNMCYMNSVSARRGVNALRPID